MGEWGELVRTWSAAQPGSGYERCSDAQPRRRDNRRDEGHLERARVVRAAWTALLACGGPLKTEHLCVHQLLTITKGKRVCRNYVQHAARRLAAVPKMHSHSPNLAFLAQ
eukprot:6191226-Pleurochrysis_carterae.AAC.2